VDEAEQIVQLAAAQVLQGVRRVARHSNGSATGGIASKYDHEHLICITNKLYSQALFQQQGSPFPQVQLPPLQSWMHHTGHASAEVCQTWSIIAKFILLLFIMLNLVTYSYSVNYSSI
jgi:hypothetical protein